MGTTYTKAQYEEYLNNIMDNIGPKQLAVGEDEYIAQPGTWMRRNDPIQFEVGYNEWVRETQNS